MRPSLMPGLIMAAQKNADRGFADVALFEVGQMFKGDRPEDQFTAATRPAPRAGAARGHRPPLAEQSAARSTPSTPRPTPSPCWPPPARRCRRCRWCPAGRPGSIPAAAAPSRSGRRTCSAHFGELHPRALAALDAEGPLVGFEVVLEKIPEPKAKADARQAAAGVVAVPAGDARFRLHGRRGREGRRHRARGAERRPEADRERQRVRRLRGHWASSRARSRSPSPSPCSRATRP